ncbi:MAG: glycoside hydrolase family 16 protein, partial [Candidatus Xenobia bacterium]
MFRRLLPLALVLLALPLQAAKPWHLAWSDEFNHDGRPDPTKWTYERGFVRNQELQYYQSQNAWVENGHLIIEARHQHVPNPAYLAGSKNWKTSRPMAEYTSASLTTRGLATWTYGRIEASIEMPSGRGVWPAFWMLGANDTRVGWPDCGEIDIMENVGFEPNVNHGSIHTKAFNWMNDTQKTATIPVPDATTKFHRYAIDWDAERIEFSVDDRRFLTFQNPHLTRAEWPFDQPMFIILNDAVGGMWGGQKG